LSTIRKGVTIFLLAVFLFNLVGYIPLFTVVRYSIKKEIKNRLKKSLSEDQLHVVSVSTDRVAKLQWEEDGREFRHKGIMYDVVRTESKNGVTYFHCVNDAQETKLFAHLDKLINDQLDTDKSPFGKSAKAFAKFFSLFNYLSTDNYCIAIACTDEFKYFEYSSSLCSAFRAIFVPPPNQVA